MSRVRDLPKATAVSAGDYLLIDGPSGTRAIQANKIGGTPNAAVGRQFAWMDLIRPGGLTQHNTVVRMENKGTFDTRAVQTLNNHTYSDLFLGDYWDLPGAGKIVVGGFGIAPGFLRSRYPRGHPLLESHGHLSAGSYRIGSSRTADHQ